MNQPSALSDNNQHIKVVDVAGFRIAGLGGVFLGRNWRPGELPKWQNRKHWLKFTPKNVKKIPLKLDHSIWYHEFDQMKKKIRADILVTHEAPSCHRYGFEVIDELAEAIGAQAIFHGHHHEYYRDSVNNNIQVTGVAIGRVVNLAGDELMTIIGNH
ncbi:metallophosphoesterase family protein [methane-oxidizing endosymbiont of Gigantopelta aegis]|uniref:metallophosphoesterase family protein n=1 Tax=methane-oxidizing endosymbiont of Gigantopelta aegis TaxID=2794938 RepID=UPI0018DC2EDB|nr:metallophosphoesterase family protein [methane-oxidizing endosymbiont of Gigantopelta aegis]